MRENIAPALLLCKQDTKLSKNYMRIQNILCPKTESAFLIDLLTSFKFLGIGERFSANFRS